MAAREDRLSREQPKQDQRSPGQTDRDRILYSTEFRRLSGVTQVVSPGQEEIFHNRLTHTLKVAQIARRFAEYFRDNHPTEVKSWGGIDPDVTEAASLAHDLGHPPFGHLAEKELDASIKEVCVRASFKNLPSSRAEWEPQHAKAYKDAEGFEGNAQSFRIITRLAVRRQPEDYKALDLTRATLNATLKYPTLFAPGVGKYGCYADDHKAFDFARDGSNPGGAVRSLEAQIMDWSDDIAYSVHDVEDFYRAGLIPLDRLSTATSEQGKFREYVEGEWDKITGDIGLKENLTAASIVGRIFEKHITLTGPYTGTRQVRADLYAASSNLIDHCVKNTKLVVLNTGVKDALAVPDQTKAVVAVLKRLIWFYVIQSPALAAQQYGQRSAIRSIFSILYTALGEGKHYLFPASFQDQAKTMNDKTEAAVRARLVADAVASLTDQQALRLYQRLTASSQGSVLDPIFR